MKKRHILAGVCTITGAAIAGKLLTRPQDIFWAEHASNIAHGEHSRFALVDGIRIHYQEAGEPPAPAVLLIHGFCASTFVWSDVFLPLAESGFRVIVPDLMGFGFSEKPSDRTYTIEEQAKLIVGLMDNLQIKRASMVGSSYGGAVAAICALDYPDRVERLVLVGAVTNDEARTLPILKLAASPIVGDIGCRLVLGSRRIVHWRLRSMFRGKPHLLEEKRLRSHHLPLLAAKTQAAAIRTLRSWRADRIARDASLIQHPALLIWGEDDPDIPLRNGKTLHRSMPCSRLVVFRRCGHIPQEEYPSEFTEVVSRFLREREKTTGEC